MYSNFLPRKIQGKGGGAVYRFSGNTQIFFSFLENLGYSLPVPEEKNSNFYIDSLNDRQKQAVMQTEGPLLILAGAGAGKTKTITHRIFHLIKGGVRPSAILAITFTNKAAKEMRERTLALLAQDPSMGRNTLDEKPFISTFHSLGVHILKEHASLFGFPRHFSIFDKSDSKKAVKEAMEIVGVDSKQYDPAVVMSIISKEKGSGVSFDEFAKNIGNEYMENIALRVWGEYEKILQKEKAFDFDDLLLKTLQILKRAEIVEKYNSIWQYIHVDEYQDTNKVQYQIMKLLAQKSNNIAVVGDIDQSIYSWRGADFKNIMRFEKDYSDVATVLLEENYRSTKTIIAVSNAIIAKNVMRKEKNVFTANPHGDKITVHGSYNERDEADYIARTAKMLIKQGVNAQEIAVLYRANFQSRAIEEACLTHELPYTLLGTKFFERKEVKDVLSYLKLALNPDSMSDLKRAINFPSRGIGKVTLLKILEGKEDDLPKAAKEKIKSFRKLLEDIKECVEQKKPSEIIKHIILHSGIQTALTGSDGEDAERLENIKELVTIAAGYDQMALGEGIEKFLEHISLSSDQDDLKEEKKGIRLMTVHASKGLEFDYVFIAGLEQDLFPHKRINERGGAKEDTEEERRLFYVALTRARKKVYLTYANIRTIFGSASVTIPSEFVLEIDDALIEVDGHEMQREKIVYLDF